MGSVMSPAISLRHRTHAMEDRAVTWVAVPFRAR